MFRVPLKYDPLVLGLHSKEMERDAKCPKGRTDTRTTWRKKKKKNPHTYTQTNTPTAKQRREDEKASSSNTSLIHTWATHRRPWGPAFQDQLRTTIQTAGWTDTTDVFLLTNTGAFKPRLWGWFVCSDWGGIKVKEWALEILFKEKKI